MRILRLIKATGPVLAVLLAISPGLQAWAMAQGSAPCAVSCCCGCSHDGSSGVEAPTVEGVCCCRVGDPSPVSGVPLEGSIRPVGSPDYLAALPAHISSTELQVCRRGQAIEEHAPPIHGPPLYLLNSTYLI